MTKKLSLNGNIHIDNTDTTLAMLKNIKINRDREFFRTISGTLLEMIMLPYNSTNPITINGTSYAANNTLVMGFSICADGGLVLFQIGCITYSDNGSLHGKIVYRYRHGNFGTKGDWKFLN